MEPLQLIRFRSPEEIPTDVDKQFEKLNFGCNGQMLLGYTFWTVDPDRWPGEALAIMDGGTVLGWMLTIQDPPEPDPFLFVFVAEAQRRKGYATSLFRAFLAAEDGFRRGILTTWDRRSRALGERVAEIAAGRVRVEHKSGYG